MTPPNTPAQDKLITMSKFTPGPWAVLHPKFGDTGPTRIVLENYKDEYSDEICVLYTNPDGSTGNAALIAAAPDMYEALSMLVMCSQHDSTRITSEFIDKIRKILNKAKGRA